MRPRLRRSTSGRGRTGRRIEKEGGIRRAQVMSRGAVGQHEFQVAGRALSRLSGCAAGVKRLGMGVGTATMVMQW